eukprot:1954810-Prymnesium_polylepis.1
MGTRAVSTESASRASFLGAIVNATILTSYVRRFVTAKNVYGLMTSYDVDKSEWPSADGSLYNLLGTVGNEEKVVNSCPLSAAPRDQDD